MDWLEISLTVNGELAEAVAEVLARFAPNRVAAAQGVRYEDATDAGTADGPVTVRAYVPVDGRTADTRKRIEESLHLLGMISALPAPTFKLVPDQNWMEAWKQHYGPIPIGQRLIVVPAWLDSTEAGRIPIRINPGMAFGTGTHPSTQLCLQLVESVLDSQLVARGATAGSANTFIDVGCGSGILSIAALKLGAIFALGVDIDARSIQNARENATLNGIGPELELGVGSVRDILGGAYSRSKASLVAANILAPAIVDLFAEGLGQLAENGGAMILGGILQEQEDDVLSAARPHGFGVRDRCQMGDWIALAMQR